MEFIVLVILLVILIILVTVSLFKNINESNITERLGKLELSLMKEMGDFKIDLNKDFNELNEKIEKILLLINEKVNERLDENFEKTNKTFMNVIERLTKTDEAQKKIENLSTDIVDLQSILTDKKTRGIFGEINLKHILTSVFGEKNDNIYKLQYTLSTGVISDSVLFTT